MTRGYRQFALVRARNGGVLKLRAFEFGPSIRAMFCGRRIRGISDAYVPGYDAPGVSCGVGVSYVVASLNSLGWGRFSNLGFCTLEAKRRTGCGLPCRRTDVRW
jgi:hypothetical protein